MSYATNPAGIGVGKRYGARGVGGTSGVYDSSDSTLEISLALGHGEMDGPLGVKLPPFCEIKSAFVSVEKAFADGATISFKVGSGGTAITTAVPLKTVGVADAAITGLAPTKTGADGEDLVVTASATAISSATGKARLTIVARRV